MYVHDTEVWRGKGTYEVLEQDPGVEDPESAFADAAEVRRVFFRRLRCVLVVCGAVRIYYCIQGTAGGSPALSPFGLCPTTEGFGFFCRRGLRSSDTYLSPNPA